MLSSGGMGGTDAEKMRKRRSLIDNAYKAIMVDSWNKWINTVNTKNYKNAYVNHMNSILTTNYSIVNKKGDKTYPITIDFPTMDWGKMRKSDNYINGTTKHKVALRVTLAKEIINKLYDTYGIAPTNRYIDFGNMLDKMMGYK